MALETLGTFTQSELDYIRECGRIKAELDWQCDMTEARREARQEGRLEGRSEGLAEGLNKASLDIAQKMKTMGFLAEQIQTVTGIPLEQITINK